MLAIRTIAEMVAHQGMTKAVNHLVANTCVAEDFITNNPVTAVVVTLCTALAVYIGKDIHVYNSTEPPE